MFRRSFRRPFRRSFRGRSRRQFTRPIVGPKRWEVAQFDVVVSAVSAESTTNLVMPEMIAIPAHMFATDAQGVALSQLARAVEVAGVVFNWECVQTGDVVEGALAYGRCYMAWVTDRRGSGGVPQASLNNWDPFQTEYPVAVATSAAISATNSDRPVRILHSETFLQPIGEFNALSGYSYQPTRRRTRLRLKTRVDDDTGLYLAFAYSNPAIAGGETVSFRCQGQLYYRVVFGRG